jgi:hypothetical protein
VNSPHGALLPRPLRFSISPTLEVEWLRWTWTERWHSPVLGTCTVYHLGEVVRSAPPANDE